MIRFEETITDFSLKDVLIYERGPFPNEIQFMSCIERTTNQLENKRKINVIRSDRLYWQKLISLQLFVV